MNPVAKVRTSDAETRASVCNLTRVRTKANDRQKCQYPHVSGE